MTSIRKTFIVLILLLSCSSLAYSQVNWGAYSQSSTNEVANNPSTVGLIVNIVKDNNSFWAAKENSSYFYTLSNDTVFKRLHAESIIARTTFDTSKVHFFFQGIDKRNASKYQYRVVEYPNRVIEPWATISKFTDSAVIKSSGHPQMGYLGGYSAKLSNMIVVDVRKISDGQIISTALVAWEAIQPIVTNIYTSDNFDAFLQRLQYPWAKNALSKTSAPLQDLELPSTNTNLIFFLKADIYHRKQVQYQLVRNGEIITIWKDNDYDNSFIWLKQNQPGNYQLKIRYSVQPNHITTYRFSVLPAWYQTTLFKIAIGIIFIAFLGGLLFMVLLIRQKRLTRLESSNRTKLQLELKAIYAQLNPHFVFNALSSIQGLINKQDIRGANSYLSDFAKLMRESLQSGNREETPLKKEIVVLETYLRLEKLRFGFEFQIVVQENINTYEINIPSLLLQPLVENAIKHGISGDQKDGNITIHFNAIADDIVVTISDNGRGFDPAIPTLGYGLKLTRDRIELLNKLKPVQRIDFNIQSEPTGTEITLAFNNWLL